MATWATTIYFLGVAVSPWMEMRIAVPVEPFLIYGVVAGFSALTHRLLRSPRLAGALCWCAALIVVDMSLLTWTSISSERDEYSPSFYLRGRTFAAQLDATQAFSENAVVLGPGDAHSFALTSGRPAASTSPAEWKTANAATFRPRARRLAWVSRSPSITGQLRGFLTSRSGGSSRHARPACVSYGEKDT